jgi:hypothetical protein
MMTDSKELIAVWCDGTWCELDELSYMTHMSDDFTYVDVSGMNEYEIESAVTEAVNHG